MDYFSSLPIDVLEKIYEYYEVLEKYGQWIEIGGSGTFFFISKIWGILLYESWLHLTLLMSYGLFVYWYGKKKKTMFYDNVYNVKSIKVGILKDITNEKICEYLMEINYS